VWKSEHEVISLEQFAFDNLFRAVRWPVRILAAIFPVPAVFMYLIMLYSLFVLMHKRFFYYILKQKDNMSCMTRGCFSTETATVTTTILLYCLRNWGKRYAVAEPTMSHRQASCPPVLPSTHTPSNLLER